MTELATQELARVRAARIRAGIGAYLSTLADVAAAYAQRDWVALGYADWQAYVDGEFSESRLRLSPEHRAKAVAELRLAGMSTRAIGSALGTSEATVRRDLSTASNDAVDSPERVTSLDGRERPATRPPMPARQDLVDAIVADIDQRPTAPGWPDTEPDRPQPPTWDPEERRRHEEEVRRIRDIDAARRQAETIVTDVLAAVVTVVAGCRYGDKGLVTKDMIREMREAIDLLEGEL